MHGGVVHVTSPPPFGQCVFVPIAKCPIEATYFRVFGRGLCYIRNHPLIV
jgi:hypothetical protein